LKADARLRLIIIGPVPPPLHGVAVSTTLVLANPVLLERFRIEHLDTSDHRPVKNIGAWDRRNIALGVRHPLELHRRLRGERGIVYLPLSQSTGGFLRDSIFIGLATARGWRVAAHLRGGQFREFYWSQPHLVRAWMRFSLNRVDSLAVMGSSLRSLFQEILPEHKIRVVPNGSPDLGPRELEGRSETVLFLSNLRQRKGVIEAFEAARLVVREHPTARFLFVGEWEDPQLERTLTRRAADSRGRITFHPPVHGEAKRELLLSSSILLFPPVEPEGHPRVVLEGLSAGLPVVATNQGAIAETIVDGESGFILASAAPDELAERILLLLHDPRLRDRMAKAARARYLDHFTQERADTHLADWLTEVGLRCRHLD
jgi:glycosyltransferase involved in cell wall biosynthesis